MMCDDDGVFFNPFMIGPPEYSKRYEYKQPTHVVQPPYATMPKEHTNKSVSKGTFFAKQEREDKTAESRSQLGEICFSKAIKKDMAAAKQLANGLNDEDQRIYAGRAASAKVSEADLPADSVRTLLPVRSKRSQRSVSQASRTPSQLSDQHSSKSSVRSLHNKPTDSNVTLMPQRKKPLHKDVDTDLYGHNSRSSVRSRTREYSGQHNTSYHSMTASARREDRHADKVSRVSARSHNDRTDRTERTDRTDRNDRTDRTDRIDRHSHASVSSRYKLDNDQLQSDNKNSRVSLRSKTTERQSESVSLSVISRERDERKTNHKTDSKSKSKSHRAKRSDSRPSIQEVAESIQRELIKSMETTKALSIKAAELNERLKAGNEFKHNRFNTLARQCIQNEPLKRCREDRMALWRKESVLS
ncbi:hypothetical protein KR093_006229 [Drosophila rubida]|uniref:Uncharacterized protein n=1 Tax=Drosophila rubida TaxID=30044 RepID=A0AAD4PNL5_9MUSC|nr:hypothetical protein KR093_006229 [Drosophila rubida]